MSAASPASAPTRQQARAAARRGSRLSQARLAGYLAAAAGSCGLATTADAEIVQIDISAFDGPNGGVPLGGSPPIYDWAGSGTGTLYPSNGYEASNGNKFWGLYPGAGLFFAVSKTGSPPRDYFPTNFSRGSAINDSVSFYSGSADAAGFYACFQDFNFPENTTFTSPDFGPNSFMGFRFENGSDFNYGWLEVTWDSANTTWQVFSGAYESTVNTPILAGAVPVPEPGATPLAFGALASLCLGGSALKRWKKQRRSEPQGDAREPGSTSDLPQTAA